MDDDHHGSTELVTYDDNYNTMEGPVSAGVRNNDKAQTVVNQNAGNGPSVPPAGPRVAKYVKLACGGSQTRDRLGLGFQRSVIAESKHKGLPACKAKLRAQARNVISCDTSACGSSQTCEPEAELLKKTGWCIARWHEEEQKYYWECYCRVYSIKYSCTDCAEPEDETLEHNQTDPKALSYNPKSQ